jgi:hypothetical protein
MKLFFKKIIIFTLAAMGCSTAPEPIPVWFNFLFSVTCIFFAFCLFDLWFVEKNHD